MAGFRARLECMWRAFEPHADSHFLEEFANHTHARFWEMYVACVMLELAHTPLRSGDAGPDLFFTLPGTGEVALEAIAPGPGSGPDEVTLPPSGEGRYVSLEPSLVRLRHGIEEKHRKYHEHLAKGYLSGSEPFVIALSGRHVPYSGDPDYPPPLIVQAVFPLAPVFAFDLDDADSDARLEFRFRDHVKKAKGAPVSTTVFTDPFYTHISAIIFSGTADSNFNLPQRFGSDFIVIHNPLAVHPLPLGFVGRGLEFWEDGDFVKGKDWG